MGVKVCGTDFDVVSLVIWRSLGHFGCKACPMQGLLRLGFNMWVRISIALPFVFERFS